MSVSPVSSLATSYLASLLQQTTTGQATTPTAKTGSLSQEDILNLSQAAQQGPDALAALLGTQTSAGTSNALLTGLMNRASAQSDPAALLTLLRSGQAQDPLLAPDAANTTLSALFA